MKVSTHALSTPQFFFKVPALPKPVRWVHPFVLVDRDLHFPSNLWFTHDFNASTSQLRAQASDSSL